MILSFLLFVIVGLISDFFFFLKKCALSISLMLNFANKRLIEDNKEKFMRELFVFACLGENM